MNETATTYQCLKILLKDVLFMLRNYFCELQMFHASILLLNVAFFQLVFLEALATISWSLQFSSQRQMSAGKWCFCCPNWSSHDIFFFLLMSFKVGLCFLGRFTELKETRQCGNAACWTPCWISDLAWIKWRQLTALQPDELRKAPTLPGLRLLWWKMYSMHSLSKNHSNYRFLFKCYMDMREERVVAFTFSHRETFSTNWISNKILE